MAGTYKRGRKIWNLRKAFTTLILAFLILSLLQSFLHFPEVPKAKAWVPWVPNYRYRKGVLINGTAGAGVGYQLKFRVWRQSGTDNGNEVYLGTKCLPDFGDVRFADSDGNVFPYYIISQTADYIDVWINPNTVDLSSNQVIYIYYGNLTAEAGISQSNLDDTFIFAEPWDNATLNTERWTISNPNGTYSIDVTNHKIHLSGSISYTLQSKSTLSFPNCWILEDFYNDGGRVYFYAYNYLSSAGYKYRTFAVHHSSWSSSDLGIAHVTAYSYYTSAPPAGYRVKFLAGVGGNSDKSEIADSNPSYGKSTWRVKITKKSDGKIYLDIQTDHSGVWSYSESNSEVADRVLIYFQANNGKVTFDVGAFKIRKYVEPEPTPIEWYEEEDATNVVLNVDVFPSDLQSLGVTFKLDGTTYTAPQNFELETQSHTLQALQSQININSTFIYGFDHWELNGEFYSSDLTIEVSMLGYNNLTMIYSAVKFNITSNVEDVKISSSGFSFYAPEIIYRPKGYNSFQIITLEKQLNSTHKYVYYGVYVGGSLYSQESEFSVYAESDTNLYIEYELIFSPPESNEPVITPSTSETTWYFRNDLHTVQDELGYKLSEENSMTTESYSEDFTSNMPITLGFRAWVFNKFGKTEITPNVVGLYTISSNGTHEVNATWTYTGSNEIVYAVEIKIYLRFGEGDWITMLVAITDDDLNIILPEGTWRIFYNVELFRNSTYTKATLYWGSPEYDTRIALPTAAASPWDIALLKLLNLDIVGWLLTPFTFHLGDLFYAIIVLFLCITAYNDTGSLSYILAILWLFGGGGILASFLSPITLNIAYILLAFATAFTLMKLILK